MPVTGTLVNYYIHCKRQCYLHGNKLNLEDNSEIVKIGKAIHEGRERADNTELSIDRIKIDKLTKAYLIEVKKSDADLEAAKWQLLYYLHILKEKGVNRKGRLEIVEKNRSGGKQEIIILDEVNEEKICRIVKEIEALIASEVIPDRLETASCKKCAYYEYCYI